VPSLPQRRSTTRSPRCAICSWFPALSLLLWSS